MRHQVITEDAFAEMQTRVMKDHERIGIGKDTTTSKTVRAEGRSVKEQAHAPCRVLAAPSLSYSLAITGQVPSGKNQVQLMWRNGKVHRYPNKTFTNWRAAATVQLLAQNTPAVPLTEPIGLVCEYWRGDERTRDISGQLDALFSLLVYAKILKDDGLVREVTWRRHPVNRRFPKVVMTIEEYKEESHESL